jgi:hypothetical protein
VVQKLEAPLKRQNLYVTAINLAPLYFCNRITGNVALRLGASPRKELVKIAPVIIPSYRARCVSTVFGSDALKETFDERRRYLVCLAVVSEALELLKGAFKLDKRPVPDPTFHVATKLYACFRERNLEIRFSVAPEKVIDDLGERVALSESDKTGLGFADLFIGKFGDNRVKLPAPVQELDFFAAFPIESLLSGGKLFSDPFAV